MAPRFKGLSQAEIEKLMNECDAENFADSDSDCDFDNLEESINCSLDESIKEDNINIPEKREKIEWKSADEGDEVKILKFIGKPGIQIPISGLESSYDYFKALFPNEIVEIISTETNRYAEQVFDLRPEENGKRKHSPEWKKTSPEEIELFLGTILLMGHIHKDKIHDYWSTNELIETPIFRKIMPRDRFLAILKFLHFTNNDDKPSKDSPNYDRLWKLREIFEILNSTFKKSYEPTENVAVDEVMIKFKGRVAFRQYIPKKRKQWGIKMYKISDKKGYTYDMRVYLGNDKNKSDGNSASYNVVNSMSESIKGKGHKLFMDNFFSSPELFNDLLNQKQIQSCGTIRNNRKNFPKDISQTKFKRGQITLRFSNGLTALRWKDKRDVYMLSNMHQPLEQNNTNEKPKIVADYNENMGFVDLSDRMANSYSFERRTLKWTKKLFFHLLDVVIVNAYILSKSSESHRDFRMSLINFLLKRNEASNSKFTPSSDTSGHWPFDEKKRRRCAVCSKQGIQKRVSVICKRCNVALCIDKNCFSEYHTNATFSDNLK